MNLRSKNIITATLVILAILLINLITQSLFFRIDLTSEKRYTLSNDTKEILKNLDDVVFVRVYLDGDLDIPFQQFRKSIQETLDEFKVYGGNMLEYQFIDPFEDADAKTVAKIQREFYDKQLYPTIIKKRDKKGGSSEEVIVPGAIVVYNGVEIPLNLFINNPANDRETNLNSSIENLEYTLISTIQNLTNKQVDKIAFIEGHGEWPDPFVKDITKELSKSYQIDRGKINGQFGILDPYKAIVFAGPVSVFSEADKYIIDQYIMKGGKVLWLVDAVNVNFDSLATGFTLGLPNTLQIEDMLFSYGVRINGNLIQDAQCSFVPVDISVQGSTPDFQPFPWLYYPLITPSEKHNITRNLSLVQLKFASTIDTIEARKEIKKIPLLITSNYTKIRKIPAAISLEEINTPPTEQDFNSPNQLVGVLLKGKFKSVFKNRMVSEYFEETPPATIEESKPTKMIVISDGDVIRNEVKNTPNGMSISPLGFDRYTGQTYGNKEFLVNAINYLTDDSDLLSLRGRDYKIRLLNRQRIATERLKWQIINITFPILIVIVAGIIFNFLRKRRYAK